MPSPERTSNGTQFHKLADQLFGLELRAGLSLTSVALQATEEALKDASLPPRERRATATVLAATFSRGCAVPIDTTKSEEFAQMAGPKGEQVIKELCGLSGPVIGPGELRRPVQSLVRESDIAAFVRYHSGSAFGDFEQIHKALLAKVAEGYLRETPYLPDQGEVAPLKYVLRSIVKSNPLGKAVEESLALSNAKLEKFNGPGSPLQVLKQKGIVAGERVAFNSITWLIKAIDDKGGLELVRARNHASGENTAYVAPESLSKVKHNGRQIISSTLSKPSSPKEKARGNEYDFEE